jgi:hypothetical protein
MAQLFRKRTNFFVPGCMIRNENYILKVAPASVEKQGSFFVDCRHCH